MLYHTYEMTHAALAPMREMARFSRDALGNSANPLSSSYGARVTAASLDMFVKATKRYTKPEFELTSTVIDGVEVAVTEEIVLNLPFCNLLRFKRDTKAKSQKLLIVAPLSGHYATLLRGTVTEMLPDHDVYITDWTDCRDVPLSEGEFDLDDYTDYLIKFCELLGEGGERPAVLAVCQPGVPMLVAASLMAERGDSFRPSSMTLMGAPVDTAMNPQKPNELATTKPLSWFEQNVVTKVPWPNAGFMRKVYPGFLQLSGFMSMNMERHVDAHKDHFQNLIKGDGDSTDSHRKFYDEYMAVMDLSAGYYLQTIERIFQKRLLAEGAYYYRDTLVDPSKITDIALLTVEGEKDDITGLGQTEAAHKLVKSPKDMHQHYVQEGVGHYGVFNGSRWRSKIAPLAKAFIAKHRANG
ncbi:MAG: polyhydroxyalkanoate depolymerase [Rhodobacteraceae bacterium]|nr:polyhydroxyalkanoate depolymerase [Paracoccaceae bacterium]